MKRAWYAVGISIITNVMNPSERVPKEPRQPKGEEKQLGGERINEWRVGFLSQRSGEFMELENIRDPLEAEKARVDYNRVYKPGILVVYKNGIEVPADTPID